jgi:hypothetical protein
MLEGDRYESIQQRLIDALDQAEYVEIKGQAGNQTDLRVSLCVLRDPAKETRFLNCGADLNIPVGEVFTSPRLGGTSGVLHVKQVHLRGLKFNDLRLTFQDGYAAEYTCSNFGSPEENRRYVYDNLFMPHQALPLGEFAIGTNTLAYVAARRHGIMDVLPILIIEKMGPHFALGDTCFRFAEDKPVYNALDGKEVIARDNEKSALRRTDPEKAYTSTHIDISLPYEEIGSVTVVRPDGRRLVLLAQGRFVLAGTEELNAPLEELSAR